MVLSYAVITLYQPKNWIGFFISIYFHFLFALYNYLITFVVVLEMYLILLALTAMKTPMRELRDLTISLNSVDYSEEIKNVFNAYITKSIPPEPGFFESGCIEFPLECSKEIDTAYRTFSSASYRFHALDENLQYKNQENHFKYHGYYEQIFEDINYIQQP